MRRLALLLLLLPLIAAKGGKKKDEEVAAPPPETPAAPVAPVVEEAPPPPVETPSTAAKANADITVSITTADGAVKSGKVTAIERTVDFYGDEGWSQDSGKLTLTVESGTSEKQVAWTDVKSIAVTPGKVPDEVDCTYSSDFTPWMYECSARTVTAVTLKDGTKGNVTNHHRWRFTWSDGGTTEFTLYKYILREQDDRDVQFGEEQTENFALYTRLQDSLRTAMKTSVVKTISVQ